MHSVGDFDSARHAVVISLYFVSRVCCPSLPQGGLMEVEKAVSAAANLDTVVLTAKLGVAAAAVKATYDGLSHLPDALKALAGAAVAAAGVALALRLARGSQQAAPAGAPTPVAPAEAADAAATAQQQQQEAEGSGEGAAAAVGSGSAAAVAIEREEPGVRSS